MLLPLLNLLALDVAALALGAMIGTMIAIMSWVFSFEPEVFFEIPMIRKSFVAAFGRSKSPIAAKRKEIVKQLLESIVQRPEEWFADEHTFKHRSGLELWTANGVHSMAIYRPDKITFTAEQRYWLWKAYRDHEDPKEDGVIAEALKHMTPFSK